MRIQLKRMTIELLPSGVAMFPDIGLAVAAFDASVFLQMTLFDEPEPLLQLSEAVATQEATQTALFLPNLNRHSGVQIPATKNVIAISSRYRDPDILVVQSITIGGVTLAEEWQPYREDVQVCVGGLRDSETKEPAFGVSNGLLLMPLIGCSVTWPPHPAHPALLPISSCANESGCVTVV